MAGETPSNSPTQEASKSIEDLVAEINKDARIDEKDKLNIQKLYDALQNDKEGIKQETRDALTTMISESLHQGFEVKTNEDYAVLHKLLCIKLGTFASLPDYSKLQKEYGDFSVRIDNNSIGLYNLGALRAHIDPTNGTLEDQGSYLGNLMSGKVDQIPKNNTLDTAQFQILSELPEATQQMEALTFQIQEAKQTLSNPNLTQEDFEIGYAQYQSALDGIHNIVSEYGEHTLGVLKQQESFQQVEKTFAEVEQLIALPQMQTYLTNHDTVSTSSVLELKNPVDIKGSQAEALILQFVENVNKPTKAELYKIIEAKHGTSPVTDVVLAYAIQSILSMKNLGGDLGKIDGIVGNKFVASVKEYQKQNGLTVDGDVGPQTLGKMIEEFQNTPKVAMDGVEPSTSPRTASTDAPKTST